MTDVIVDQNHSFVENQDALAAMVAHIRTLVAPGKRLVFVSGDFNIVHPGHIRLLKFAAECGDFLVVGVHHDTSSAVVPESLRLEGVQEIGCVNYAFLLTVPSEIFLAALTPEIVVKGSEHEQQFNPERAVVESYGGQLLFSSGEMRFSSLELLRSEMQEGMLSAIKRPKDYLKRHAIESKKLTTVMNRFSALSVLVLGDLIVDEYITCEPLGISREDPTIVVTPLASDRFVGAAGIVAAHIKSLGAAVEYFSVAGKDDIATFAEQQLETFGVKTHLLRDLSRPTSLKQRFRAEGKTLLRVSHLRHHHIHSELITRLLKRFKQAIKTADLVVFSDFNYGCLPQPFVDEVIAICLKHGVQMVADSQSSSQIGDVSRFHGMSLVTPTEHEARLAVQDHTSGLAVLAETLAQKSRAKNIFITLGSEGVFIHAPHTGAHQLTTDQLPALNSSPKDVAGGGDSLLACASLALAAGASIWESAYLGSVAAACHVARVGNLPLSRELVLQEL